LASVSRQFGPQEELEQIELAFRAIGGGLWDYDVDGDTLFCSARWYEILGIDPAERPIRSIADFIPHIHPADVEVATKIDFEELSRLIASDQRYHVEFRIIRPDGAVRWLRSVACVLVDHDTRHTRAVGCITDMTDMRGAEIAVEGAGVIGDGQAGSLADTDDGSLSKRERECLAWVSFGKTAWETAQILGVSRRTVEFHLDNAVRKLDASNKVHAAVLAVRRKLI
jgi:DNA-binding CsgD family transcriptional regulator